MSSTLAPRVGPVAASERVEVIDVVRGFALFGVLVANLVWWTQEAALTDAQRAALPTAGVDRVTTLVLGFLVEGKFYTLFSFLFGLGFAVQLERGAARGVDAAALYRRRLWVLLAFGLVHNFLVWAGDILHLYALLGFVLLAARHWSRRTLVLVGVGVALLLPAVSEVLRRQLIQDDERKAAFRALRVAHHAALSGGGAWEVVRYHFANWVSFFTTLFCLPFLTSVLGRLLLGLLAGRERWLQEPERHLRLFRRLLVVGLVTGLIGSTVTLAAELRWLQQGAVPKWAFDAVLALAASVGLLGLGSAYLAAIVLLMRRPRWRRLLAHLAPVGRMALTNYLTHSLVILAVFYDFGLDLTGRVGSTFCVGLAVGVYSVQIGLSAWWLRRFRFGPAEWLWRSLTYGRAQPMRPVVTE